MATFSREPRLTLVGAGPGDPELITLKGIKALQQADAVLYDALVDESLLEFAPVYAEKIFVGKKPGHHSIKQEDINRFIVQYALSHGHVVRLKGGDPFVFGRGHEEIQYAAQFGIPAHVIPGVSSAIAVPAAAGIPVTRRGISESFWVITATKEDHELSKDIYCAARTAATVIILMGMAKLGKIAALYAEHEKSAMPVAIIQHGTMPEQKVVTGTMADIVQRVAASGISSPAIIVVGEVAAMGSTAVQQLADSFSGVA
jgi:uroporphyrin-III C-methyltransferase